jgi:hypothetical protein
VGTQDILCRYQQMVAASILVLFCALWAQDTGAKRMLALAWSAVFEASSQGSTD